MLLYARDITVRISRGSTEGIRGSGVGRKDKKKEEEKTKERRGGGGGSSPE